MLYKTKVAVCSENSQPQSIQHVGFLKVKTDGTGSSWQALRV